MIIINQKSVRKIPSSLNVSGAASLQLIVPVKGNEGKLEKYGLSQLKEVGDCIIPASCGAATRRNNEGRLIIHKDQKKEWHSYDVFWGRNQFCGRNETEWVEDWITRRTFRFPRTRLPAENIEVQLLKNDKGELFYSTPKLKTDNQERWVTAANVMLEVFGSFWAIEPEEANLPLVISRKVNWTILPCGNQPWPKLKTQLDGVINSMRNKAHRNHAHRSMQAICQQRPSETLIGNGGFRGYVIFCFKGKQGAQDFAVLESIHPNNATYILGGNWESISKLSKSEILNGKLHLDRYIHDREWSSRLEQLFLAHAA